MSPSHRAACLSAPDSVFLSWTQLTQSATSVMTFALSLWKKSGHKNQHTSTWNWLMLLLWTIESFVIDLGVSCLLLASMHSKRLVCRGTSEPICSFWHIDAELQSRRTEGISELPFPLHRPLVQGSMIAVLRNIDRDRMQKVQRLSRKTTKTSKYFSK